VKIRPLFAKCPVKKTERCKYRITEIKRIGRIRDPDGVEYLIKTECVWCGWKIQYPQIVWRDSAKDASQKKPPSVSTGNTRARQGSF